MSAQFGPYRLAAVLSRGPSVTVYRAHDTNHDDRVVALKVFSPELSADPAFRERFRRDAGLLSALREPHVVPIHRHGEIDGRLFLDMRLVLGLSLADVLERGPLEPARAAAIADQIAVASESLQRHGLAALLERRDVLLTGPPGRREFVQIVGLRPGRAQVPAEPPAALVLSPRGRRSREFRRWRTVLLASAAAVLVIVVALTVVVGVDGRAPQPPPADTGEPGLMATIDPAPAVVDADLVASAGRLVLVAVSPDGGIHAWDLAGGRELWPTVPGTAVAVTVTQLGGRAVAVARNRDETLVVRDLLSGAPVGTPLGTPRLAGPDEIARPGGLEAVELDGASAIITARPTDVLVPGPFRRPAPQVALRSVALPSGAEGPLLAEDGKMIDRFALCEIEGMPVAVSIVDGTTVQARDVATGARTGVPTQPQPARFSSITTARRDGVPVALTGGADNRILIWNVSTGEQVGAALVGHTGPVTALVVVQVANRSVLVSASGGRPGPTTSEVRFWDLATGAPVGPPLTGHPLSGLLPVPPVGGPPLLVAAPPGGPITVWDAQHLLEGKTR